jgi:hypothetical protein
LESVNGNKERLPFLVGEAVADLLYRASLVKDCGNELEAVKPLIRFTVWEAIGGSGGIKGTDPVAAWTWLAAPPQGHPLGSLADLAECIGISPDWARRIACEAVKAARAARRE